MKYNEEVKKICGFYIDNCHLTTMLIPHLHKIIKEDKVVVTILQSDITKNIEELLSKINLNSEMQEKIRQINWTSNALCKYSKIKENIENKINLVNEIEIIVAGTEEYIEKVNENIEKVIKKLSKKQIHILNCYEIGKYENIKTILDKHSFTINTSGIKKIEEVFTEYNKQEEKIKQTN